MDKSRYSSIFPGATARRCRVPNAAALSGGSIVWGLSAQVLAAAFPAGQDRKEATGTRRQRGRPQSNPSCWCRSATVCACMCARGSQKADFKIASVHAGAPLFHGPTLSFQATSAALCSSFQHSVITVISVPTQCVCVCVESLNLKV